MVHRASTLKRNIGSRRNYGRGLPRDGEKMSGSPRGGDGTPGYLPHCLTHRMIRSSAWLTPSHQLLHPPARYPYHFQSPVLRHRHRLFRPFVLFILRRPGLTTNHGIYISSPRHHLHLPHPIYLQHTKGAPTYHLTSLHPKIHHCFLGQAHFITPTSLKLIPFPPTHHPLLSLRVIQFHPTSTSPMLRLMIRPSSGRWRF